MDRRLPHLIKLVIFTFFGFNRCEANTNCFNKSTFNKTRDSYRGKGGSGIGVRLLYDFLKNQQK